MIKLVCKPVNVKWLTILFHPPYSFAMIILTALFTALISAGAFIKIPMIPVAMTLQTLFVFLTGLLLPFKWATLSVALYIVLGAIGLPVFTSGGGLAALLAPSGGFIFGFLLSVVVGSLLMQKNHSSILYNLIVVIIMELLTYLIGIPWLKIKLATTWAKAFSVGLVPFIIGDCVKMVVAALSAKPLYPELEKLSCKLKEREDEE